MWLSHIIKSQYTPNQSCPLCVCKKKFKSNSNQVASSNKFLNLNSNLDKVPTSKQVIINTYSSFGCKFKL
jgi:hypothetical protein